MAGKILIHYARTDWISALSLAWTLLGEKLFESDK